MPITTAASLVEQLRACRLLDGDQFGQLAASPLPEDPRALARECVRRGWLTPARAWEYARPTALGLQHGHERGLVHRDVKPSNLLLSAQGVVKLLGLGLARLPAAEGSGGPGRLPGSGVLVGTPDFIAPEQA